MPTLQIFPASRGVADTEGEPDPPGPPFTLPLIVKEKVVPLVNPLTVPLVVNPVVALLAGTVINAGEAAFIIVWQLGNELQLSGVTLLAAAENIQYSTPGNMSHETVTLLSPGTALTFVGAGADEPPSAQPARRATAAITTLSAENRFISFIFAIILGYAGSWFSHIYAEHLTLAKPNLHYQLPVALEA